MDELHVYDQYAERHQRAYNSFAQVYALEHPKPEKPKWFNGLPWMMIPFTAIVMAGIALSALRTAPVFQQIALATVSEALANAEAILAVVVIEIFLVLGRYAYVLLNNQDGYDGVKSVKKWVQAGVATAFSIAVFANLYASVSHLPIVQTIKPAIDLLIALLVGISAPLLAFISADILGITWARSERARSDMKAQYQRSVDEWFAARENSWNVRKKDYGVKIKVENASVLSLSDQTDRQDTARQLPAASGFVRTPDGQRRVIEYLNEHPEHAAIPSRKLAEMIAEATGLKIGHDTVNKARNAWKSERVQVNEDMEV